MIPLWLELEAVALQSSRRSSLAAEDFVSGLAVEWDKYKLNLAIRIVQSLSLVSQIPRLFGDRFAQVSDKSPFFADDRGLESGGDATRVFQEIHKCLREVLGGGARGICGYVDLWIIRAFSGPVMGITKCMDKFRGADQ